MNFGCTTAMVASMLLAVAGCAPRPFVNQHIEQVNSEYRELENAYYLLEDENQELCFEIDKLEAELDRLKGGGRRPSLGGGERPGGLFAPRPRPSSESEAPKPIKPGDLAPPAIEIPEIELPPVDDTAAPRPMPRQSNRPTLDLPIPEEKPSLELPEAEIPEAGIPEVEVPEVTVPEVEIPQVDRPKLNTPEPAKPSIVVPPAAAPAPSVAPQVDELPAPETPSSEPEPIDPKVTHLKLNPQMTGGVNFDDQPGDDGLMLLVEPRNRFEQTLTTAAPMSIVLLDPSEQGEKARVARWDFTPEDLESMAEPSPRSGGILLKLPWPSRAPDNRRLRLYVRYETADGRQLQTDREIVVAKAGESSNRWAPRTREASTPIETKRPATNNSATIMEPTADASAQAAPPAADVEAIGVPKLLMPPASLGDSSPQPAATKRWQPYR